MTLQENLINNYIDLVKLINIVENINAKALMKKLLKNKRKNSDKIIIH